LTNLCQCEYSKCPLLQEMVFPSLLHAMASSLTPFTPVHLSVGSWLKSFTSCLADWFLNYAPDVVNWIEVMAVQWGQIWHGEFMVVGFIQLLRMASLQTKIMAYITTSEDWKRPFLSITGMWLDFLVECQILHPIHIFFIVHAFWPPVPCSTSYFSQLSP